MNRCSRTAKLYRIRESTRQNAGRGLFGPLSPSRAFAKAEQLTDKLIAQLRAMKHRRGAELRALAQRVGA